MTTKAFFAISAQAALFFGLVAAVRAGGALEAGTLVSKGASTPSGVSRAERPVVVTSDSMEADRADNRVLFRGNVVAEEDFTLCSDEVLMAYGQDKDVEEIIATGNVRIVMADKTSTSGRAVYNRKARTIVLTESPSLVQCGNTMKGDNIIYYIDEDRAMVERGKEKRVMAVILPDKKCEEPGVRKDASGDGPVKVEEARCSRPR
ncbi:MAG: lipopolysaccharide transport periplasmic protein LptA [Deltaproteobacteria bacterium]|nr:lipopolysaccharide transport periplasmic protein LptA [Deltaproteobacteria bacterium]